MPAYEKTRERTEGAAKAVQAIHGNSCSANRVDPDPMCSTSFGGDSRVIQRLGTPLQAAAMSKDMSIYGRARPVVLNAVWMCIHVLFRRS